MIEPESVAGLILGIACIGSFLFSLILARQARLSDGVADASEKSYLAGALLGLGLVLLIIILILSFS